MRKFQNYSVQNYSVQNITRDIIIQTNYTHINNIGQSKLFPIISYNLVNSLLYFYMIFIKERKRKEMKSGIPKTVYHMLYHYCFSL